MYIMKQKEMYNIWKYHLSLNKLLLSIWNWFTMITFRNNDYENQWSTWAHWYSSCGLASTGNGKMAGFEFSTVKSIANIANTKFFPWGSRGSQNKRGDRVIHAIGKPIQHFPCSTGGFPFNQLIFLNIFLNLVQRLTIGTMSRMEISLESFHSVETSLLIVLIIIILSTILWSTKYVVHCGLGL